MWLAVVNRLARSFLHLVALPFRSRLSMQLEILALCQQLAAYQRTGEHPRIRPADRLFWAWLPKVWARWRGARAFVKNHVRDLVSIDFFVVPTVAGAYCTSAWPSTRQPSGRRGRWSRPSPGTNTAYPAPTNRRRCGGR